MKRAHRDKLLFIALVSLLVLLVSFGLLSFMTRTRDHDRLFIEYRAVRMAAAAMELYQQQGDISQTQFPPTVLGFGLYDAEGVPIIARGTAPRALPPAVIENPAMYQATLDGNTMRLLRIVGTMDEEKDHSTLDAGRRRTTANPRVITRQFLVLDYDISSYRSEFRARTFYWSGLTGSFFLLLALVWVLYHRVQTYQIQAQKQRGLVQLGAAARTLTHEIKNPLGAIQIQNAVLKRKLPEEYHDSLAVFDEEVGRIAVLVDRVRDFLQSSAGKPEPVDLCSMLDTIQHLFAFPIHVDCPGRPVTVPFDRARVRSVLENVIKNAGESMDGQGPVEVAVRELRSTVTVCVLDRGSGVAREDRERIFDPFFTTKSGGSGVGLSITRQFLEVMGGSIQVTDRTGGGSEFTITFQKEHHRAAAGS
ncbi:MAG: sensor histidine kinase [Spirochaetaceae bacterium]|nr:MAG: sensor histidine kinase [Spirochaetaceae bacterium]